MDSQLKSEIQSVLSAIAAHAPILTSQVRTDKLYELFVLGCVLRALNRVGATVTTKDSNDRPTNTVVFRLGPGLIYNPATAPSFFYIVYAEQEYELQNSLRVRGRSKVLHEIDVCILRRSDADRCRREGIDPTQSSIKFLAERKYYGRTLPLHLGREFVGLCSEFSLRIKVMVSNVGNDEIHALITRHGGTENFNISPTDPSRVEVFVGWLANEFQQVLK